MGYPRVALLLSTLFFCWKTQMAARMHFELALNHLKQGKTIARSLWRDKDLRQGTVTVTMDGKNFKSKAIIVKYEPFDDRTICSDGVVGSHLYAYTVTTEDLFADDWYVVE